MTTPVDIDKLKAEASAVSARCRRANSSRQGDPILLRAADLIDSLIAKAERVDALEAALTEIAGAYDKWNPDAQFASSALFTVCQTARNALSPKPEDAAS